MALATRSPSARCSVEEAHARTAALAQLGSFALRTIELSVVTAEALRVVRKVLQVDLCAVLEMAPSGDRFLRREWLGYRTPPPYTMTPETAGCAAYTLTVGHSVIVDDLAKEARFHCPPLEAENVVSGLSVVVRPPAMTGHGPYGCIFAGSRSHRAFCPDEVAFVESVAEILGSVVYRRRTEEALRKSEERFDLMCQSLRECALFALGPEGSITSWNVPAERLFGWRAEDVIGKHVSGLCVEEEVRKGVVNDLLERATNEGQSEAETFAVRADGTSFRALLVAHALRGEHERGTAFFIRNIAARYEAECAQARLTTELERERDTLQALIEQFPAGVVFHGAEDGRIRYMSQQLAGMYGYDGPQRVALDGIVDGFPAWFADGRRMKVDDYAGVRARRGETVRQEIELQRHDGTRCSVVDSGSPVYDRHGRLVGSVVALHDMTAEKAATRERERLLEETKRAVCARDDTIAVVSHDLRNPVSVVALAAAQLQTRADKLDAAGVRTIAARIQRRARIVQALSNLLGNALKFVAPDRCVEVAGRVEGRELVVSVHDEGPGLTPAQLAHVFDRYWQADVKEARRGLGLGLSIVKGIVEAHEGRVWAESVVGDGSTFSFALPL